MLQVQCGQLGVLKSPEGPTYRGAVHNTVRPIGACLSFHSTHQKNWLQQEGKRTHSEVCQSTYLPLGEQDDVGPNLPTWVSEPNWPEEILCHLKGLECGGEETEKQL